MAKRTLWVFAILSAWCLPSTSWAVPSVTQSDTYIRDSRTNTVFPSTVSFVHNGSSYTLSITGLAVRTRFFFNVYCLAHYMQDAPTGSPGAILRAILTDAHAKQVTMHFVRNVSADRIQRALIKGFEKNATDSELGTIQPFVKEFADAIHRDVNKNDEFVIRWLPGGTTISVFQGREVSHITSETFAKVLWSIWFGDQSVVDRHQLVRLIVTGS